MNTQTRSIPSIPFLAFLLSLLCAVSAPAATSIGWTATSVAVNTNGVLTSPTNFWNANSNAIVAITGSGGGSGTNGVTVNTNGVVSSPTNFWGANSNAIVAITGSGGGSGTNGVTVDTNGVVSSPTNFWGANSNEIVAITGAGAWGPTLGTPNQITVTANGTTNTLSLPANIIVPGTIAIGKTNAATPLDIYGAITVDGSSGEAYGTTNLARGKITGQSSDGGYPSTNAVDGDYSNFSFTGNANAGGEWWKVDLGAVYWVAKIVIVKGWTGYENRPSTYSLQTSADFSFTNGVTTLFSVASDNVISNVFGGTFFSPVQTRYIRLLAPLPQNIQLAEIEVYTTGPGVFSIPSVFNGPVNLAMVHGPLTIGALSGALQASNGVVSASLLSIANGGTGTTNGLFCTNDVIVSGATTNRMIWSGGILLSNIPNFHE